MGSSKIHLSEAPPTHIRTYGGIYILATQYGIWLVCMSSTPTRRPVNMPLKTTRLPRRLKLLFER